MKFQKFGRVVVEWKYLQEMSKARIGCENIFLRIPLAILTIGRNAPLPCDWCNVLGHNYGFTYMYVLSYR